VAVRKGEFSGKARTQAQLALSADGSSWFLAGASPDLAFQIENSSELHPRAVPNGPRDSPIAGVILGSCDLDHVLGLLLLRELQPLRVYAAASILRILREENSMFGMLNRVEPQVNWTPMISGAPFPLLAADGRDSGLRCEAHYLSGRYPKYVRTEAAKLACDEASAALFFESSWGKRVAYVPAVGGLSDELLAKISGADLLLFDGTFWSDDELIRVQGGGETAHEMGHIPVEESLRVLQGINVRRKMYIHLNNTNPILNESSPEYRTVRAAGWQVAEDNWQVEL
jgi:pyrroloquinoline quinone biosynthesis protein B